MVGGHLQLDLGQDIAQNGTKQPRPVQQIPELKRLHGVLVKIILGAVKQAIIFPSIRKALQDPAHFLPFLDQRP